jgi:hypothetical protein
MNTKYHCLECRKPISAGVHAFSQEIYGYSLCLKDQFYLEESGATAQAIDLYLALKARDFPLKLEYFDGSKHIDIAMPGKLYIEISQYQYLTDWEMHRSRSDVAGPGETKIPIILIPNDMLYTKKTFTRVVNELSKACRVMLNSEYRFSIYSAPPLTADQLQ